MKRKRAFMQAVEMPVPKADRHGLPLHDAWRIKQAEYWLQLGEPVQALDQLKTLPTSAEKNRWALKVHLAAMHAARNNVCSDEDRP
jgi:hypothetical protein